MPKPDTADHTTCHTPVVLQGVVLQEGAAAARVFVAVVVILHLSARDGAEPR